MAQVTTGEEGFGRFLSWEAASRSTIDFKVAYVDMSGDLIAGLLLSQIVYWNLPSKRGASKLRVFRDDRYWLAKKHADWWTEIRITVRQVKRALGILREKGLIDTKAWRFNGLRTTHIRIKPDNFLNAWQEAINGGKAEGVETESDSPVRTKGTDRKVQKVPTERDERSRPITESTPETKDREDDNNNSAGADCSPQIQIHLSLLEELGVTGKARDELAALEGIGGPLLASWQLWLEEADTSRYTNPVGFAISQLRELQGPPNGRGQSRGDSDCYDEAAERRQQEEWQRTHGQVCE